MGPANSSNKLWRRRDVVKLLGATAITGPMILRGTTASAATSRVIKIGHVSSQTGVFAGNSWADAKRGFPAALQEAGYKLIDTGRFQPFSDDFGSQISAFKSAGVEIVTGTVTTPDFTNFWNQAAQQGFKPKVVTVGKALFDSGGDRGNRLPFGRRADQVVRETGQECQQNTSGCRPMAKERHRI
jgi:Periplasmic binding protein